ncbi:4Fe-4S dicluster domain-containing protein [[Clostridium] spiroforme]|nr:4Fe-4S dicluster domain-containing protein [Thomasclavelia spiroformis]
MLFYFTATGNSLFVAQKLDKKPISIPQELKKQNLLYQDDVIGIVCPIYAGELPRIVQKFIKYSSIKAKYIYLILTYGNDDTVACQWSKKFCENNNIHVNYIHTIKMVDNYLPTFNMDEQMNIDKHENEQIKTVIEEIQQKKCFIPKSTKQAQKLYATVAKKMKEHPELNNGKNIIMSDRCEGCTICQQVCPTGNIVLQNRKAKRIHQTCDFCLSCVHNCPFKAIDLVIDKNPKARYRHPLISLKDIVKSNNQGGKTK